jgi:hypothetical protein
VRIKSFSEFSVSEMTQITKKGKSVIIGDKKLRDVTFKELDDNIAFFRTPEGKGNWLMPEKKFWLYVLDSDAEVQKLGSGENEMLFFPARTRMNIFSVNPIKDVWKRSWLNKHKGSEHILALAEGFADKDRVLIKMMSVKPAYQHNKMNTLMLDSLRDSFPGAKLVFEDPTEDGYAFMKAYAPDAKIRWTIGWDSRPKAYKQDHAADEAAERERFKKAQDEDGED